LDPNRPSDNKPNTVVPGFSEIDLDAELVFDRYIGADGTLDVLQEALTALAPRWASKLRIWRGPRDQRPIGPGRQNSLSAMTMAATGERGSTYRSLTDRHGVRPFERQTGSVELRGNGPELVAVISIDTTIASPLGAKYQLGNHIALQVRRPRVGRLTGDTWLGETFEFLCARLSPAWAWAGASREYWAKVMSDPPRVEAVGRDFAQFLPGLFWINFFGRRYSELIGADRLMSTPAERVAAIDDGTLIRVTDDPTSWNTPEYAVREQVVRAHLGTELFFSKAEPERLTVAPDWEI